MDQKRPGEPSAKSPAKVTPEEMLEQMGKSAGNLGAASPVTPESWRGRNGTGIVSTPLKYLPKRN
jgi:hypothetical protein